MAGVYRMGMTAPKLFADCVHAILNALRLKEIYAEHGFEEPRLVVMDLRVDRHTFQSLARVHDVVFHLEPTMLPQHFHVHGINTLTRGININSSIRSSRNDLVFLLACFFIKIG